MPDLETTTLCLVIALKTKMKLETFLKLITRTCIHVIVLFNYCHRYVAKITETKHLRILKNIQ